MAVSSLTLPEIYGAFDYHVALFAFSDVVVTKPFGPFNVGDKFPVLFLNKAHNACKISSDDTTYHMPDLDSFTYNLYNVHGRHRKSPVCQREAQRLYVVTIFPNGMCSWKSDGDSRVYHVFHNDMLVPQNVLNNNDDEMPCDAA